MDLPEALRAARAAHGDQSQRAAAAEMGVTYNQVSRWETGSIPAPEAARPLMAYLGVSQQELGAIILETRMREWRRKP